MEKQGNILFQAPINDLKYSHKNFWVNYQLWGYEMSLNWPLKWALISVIIRKYISGVRCVWYMFSFQNAVEFLLLDSVKAQYNYDNNMVGLSVREL